MLALISGAILTLIIAGLVYLLVKFSQSQVGRPVNEQRRAQRQAARDERRANVREQEERRHEQSQRAAAREAERLAVQFEQAKKVQQEYEKWKLGMNVVRQGRLDEREEGISRLNLIKYNDLHVADVALITGTPVADLLQYAQPDGTVKAGNPSEARELQTTHEPRYLLDYLKTQHLTRT